MKYYLFPVFGMLLMAAFSPAVLALDLGINTETTGGDTGSGGSAQVEVSNLPIQTMKKISGTLEEDIPYVRVHTADSYVLEAAKDISLPFEEIYQSPPLDVRDWREVVIYVIPDQLYSESIPVTMYQLDAAFLIRAGEVKKFQKFGEKASSDIGLSSWQEFGAVRSSETTGEWVPGFEKLTTGATSSRALATKIYGPFLRLTLKNLTPESKIKFKIMLYLTR